MSRSNLSWDENSRQNLSIGYGKAKPCGVAMTHEVASDWETIGKLSCKQDGPSLRSVDGGHRQRLPARQYEKDKNAKASFMRSFLCQNGSIA